MIKVIFSEGEEGHDIESLFAIAEKELCQTAPMQVDMAFLSIEEIKSLNFETRNIDKETDVLSYPELCDIFGKKLTLKNCRDDIDPETGNIMLGSIAICKEVASLQAEEFGHSLKREMGYLAVHGLLHLFGYDHMEEADKQVMRDMEERILTKAGYTRNE